MMPTQRKLLLPGLVLLAGIALSWGLFMVVQEREKHLNEDAFRQQAIPIASALQGGIDRNAEVMESLAALYAQPRSVTREEFKGFAAGLLSRHGDIQALEWVPRVPDAQRTAYEERAGREGFPGFRITERAGQGKMVPEGKRPEYFPVYFAEPLQGNETAMGFDLASNPKRLQALEAARDSGMQSATARIKLVQETGTQYGFLVFQPVYRKGASVQTVDLRRAALAGFALGLFRIGDMVDHALRSSPTGAVTISLQDLSAPEGERQIYQRQRSTIVTSALPGRYRLDLPIQMSGRHWSLHLESTPAFEPPHGAGLAWAILITGLVITGMLSAFLRVLLTRAAEQQEHALARDEANRQLKTEIDEHRRVENALRESEGRFRSLFEAPSDGVVLIGLDGKIVICNQQFAQMHGYARPEDVTGMGALDFVAPEDRPVAAADMQLMPEKRRLDKEYLFRRKDGSRFPAEITASLVIGEQASPQGILGIVRDISERSVVEDQIRKQQELTIRIIETIPMRVFWKDRDLRYLGCNTLFAKDAGFAHPDGLIGKNDFDMGWKDQAELYRADDRLVMESKRPKLSYDEPQTTPEGARIWLRTSKVPLLDAANETIGLLGVYEDITTYKQMELRSLESERRFRNLAETTSDWVWQVDERGTYVFVSSKVYDILGYEPEEVLGKTPFDFMLPDEAARVGEIFKDIASRQNAFSYLENTNIHKDGHKVILETSGVPVVGEDGIFRGYFGTDRDISERKRMDVDLRESEQRLNAILNTAVDGIVMTDMQSGTFVLANQALCDMLGYSLEELYGIGVSDIHPPEALTVVQQHFQGNMRVVPDLPVKRKDGSVFFADISAAPMALEGRSFMVAIFHNVTERKQAEEKIRESEIRYRGIFEYADDIIYLLAPDGTFTSLNPAFERLTGWTPKEWLGKPFAPLIHPGDLPRAVEVFQQTLSGKSTPTFELRIARKSGGYFDSELSIVPVDASGGLAAIGIARDITERKLGEEKIRRLNEELEIKVQKRTQQLVKTQEELVRKEKLAVLGQVAGSVGHELRNPLGVMSNAVYFLQTVLTGEDESVKEYLEIIKNEIAGSERIVADLLDSVRTKPPHPEAVGVAELIDQTLQKYTVPASVTVRRGIPPTLPPLRVDPLQMHQVFRNLISNAVEAMPEGGTLEISAVENMQDGTITVSVRDSGIGMTREQLGKLFQPLFTTKARGIGLGLVVVKNLTQANGGTVQVESEAGKGTRFIVTLPLADAGRASL